MRVLKGVLKESEQYYRSVQKKIIKKLASLPRGSIKERIIRGKKYYYLQERIHNKIVHKYLGKKKPEDILKKIKMRKALRRELKDVKESLKILARAKGRKRD